LPEARAGVVFGQSTATYLVDGILAVGFEF
jgi:hypothetical protein